MSDTYQKPSVRSELREAQTAAQELRDYRSRLIKAGGIDPKILLDMEEQCRKAMAQAQAKVRLLEERIAWAIHRSQS